MIKVCITQLLKELRNHDFPVFGQEHRQTTPESSKLMGLHPYLGIALSCVCLGAVWVFGFFSLIAFDD